MNPNDNDDSRSVALYWDFENLHAGLMEAKYGEGAYAKQDNRFKVQEPLIDVQALVELGASFGPVAINRAYDNWQYFGRYRDALLQSAVELIQLFPPGASAKNGADIKLCLDATEDISRFAHIDTVIIVGGDSDFMPVAQKIKARRSHPDRHRQPPEHQQALGQELPRVPLLRQPGRSPQHRRSDQAQRSQGHPTTAAGRPGRRNAQACRPPARRNEGRGLGAQGQRLAHDQAP